ncbi:MAG: HAMP domain-containing sensor histidine kinase [Bacteroidota bacterium]|nr:HAMP domain-containing sensor histidine kinase [Bacteroidota bacterium]
MKNELKAFVKFTFGFILMTCLLITEEVYAQHFDLDGFRQKLSQCDLSDSSRVNLNNEIASAYHFVETDSRASNKKIAESQFNFELEKKQKEIELLEKDSSLKDSSNNMHQLISLALTAFLLLFISMSVIFFRSKQKEKKARQLIGKQKDEIQAQSEKLDELNKVKDKIFTVLSHDIKTPLAQLSNVINLLELNILSNEDFLFVKRSLDKQLIGLNIFLDNLLQWSKSQMDGNAPFRKENFFLAQMIDQVFSLFHENAAQKEVKLVNKVPHSIMLFSDKNQLEIVFRNLIINGIKFSEMGGEVIVDAKQEGDKICIEVIDAGIGIHPDKLKKLLCGFTNLSSMGTFGEKGTGLGLLLCKEFVEKNNGTITVNSELGIGTTFSVCLAV